jgi:polar amino acid transport system substrate-binding protein
MFINTKINISCLPTFTKLKIYRNVKPLIFGLILSALIPGVAKAETVMQKVARTGVLTAGTSRDALPFAYSDKQGKLTGYSVDMLTLIQQQLQKELGKKIKLKLVAVTPAERIPKIINRQVDIVCDASSFTWERDKKVDFSSSYGVTGTQILIKKDNNLGSPESLINKRIGVLAGTTNEQAIKRIQPNAKLVYLKTRPEAILLG